MKNIVWYLLAGTRGGETRAVLLVVLKKQPMNAHQLAKVVNLDYKTVQHHLRVLLSNNVLTAINKGGYGAAYFVSPELDGVWQDFRQIWERVGKMKLKKQRVR